VTSTNCGFLIVDQSQLGIVKAVLKETV